MLLISSDTHLRKGTGGMGAIDDLGGQAIAHGKKRAAVKRAAKLTGRRNSQELKGMTIGQGAADDPRTLPGAKSANPGATAP
jgi:hypothetical protein